VATLLSVRHAVLFALEREASPFLKSRKSMRSFADAPCRAALVESASGSLIVGVMGVGFDRARSAVHWLLQECTPRLVVVAGFAGALDSELKLGDIVIASEVIEAEDQVWRTALPAELGDETCGRLLTSRTLIATRAHKQRLNRSTGAIAVDMESAAIAEACQAERVPCAVVRVISDSVEQELSPELVRIMGDGRVSLWKVLGAAARQPGLIRQFWRLGRDSKFAAKKLANALNRLVPA
jgi:adenosylhomocysteine nucleosidase